MAARVGKSKERSAGLATGPESFFNEGRASDGDVEEIAGRSGASMDQGVRAGSGPRRGDAGAPRVSRRAARHRPGGYRADRAAAVSRGAGPGAHRTRSGA